MSCRMCTVLWHTPNSAANWSAVHRQWASNRESKSGTELFYKWGRLLRRLSCTASLPSRNALTHRVTVWYGNAASPHAWHSPGKHPYLLWPLATSILIQERFSSFVSMVVDRSRYPYESQRTRPVFPKLLKLTPPLGITLNTRGTLPWIKKN